MARPIHMFSARAPGILSSVFCLALLSAAPCASQLLPFTYYTPREGLVSNGIHALCQDSRGYLWIGTSEGLSVFDGDKFVNYRTNDGLALNFVTSLTESRKSPGTMWIGTLGGGVSKFSGGRWKTIQCDSATLADQVSKIIEDHAGIIWCASPAGLYAIRDDRPSRVRLESALEPVNDIAETPDGRLWVGVGSRLAVLDTTRTSPRMVSLRAYCRGTLETIFADADTTLWIGTSDGFLLHLRDTTLLGKRSIGTSGPVNIADDGNGDLWVCAPPGLHRIAKARFLTSAFLHYTTDNGLPANDVLTCLFDRENNLWLGGSGQGLSKWTDRRTLSFPLRPPPGGYMYHPAAAEDSRGHLWAISADGVWEFRRDGEMRWSSELHALRFIDKTSQVTWIQFDSAERMWIGFADGTTCSAKISAAGSGSSALSDIRYFRPRLDSPPKRFAYLVKDRRGNNWLSCAPYGIRVVDAEGKPVREYTVADGLPSNDIRDVYQDRDGCVWLAGVEGGILVIPGEGLDIRHAQRITAADGLPDDRVRALLQDREGRMWIATRHGGVARYDRGGIRSVSLKDGLLSNTVWWMTEDAFGSIWIGTQMGMQRIDKNSLSLFPVVKDLLGDGIICCGVSRDSIVWSYQPKRFTIHEHLTGAAHPVPPLVNITKFQVNGADVDLERPHEFRYDENVCTIEYIGINFRDEKAVRYQYRLRGAGPEWHPSTDHHAVTFATLNPGSYVFEVRAISGEGVYSTDASSLAFTIVPPFWQQWWFRVLAASCLAGLFFFFYRYRMAKVLEIERTRNRIARDLHDEVGGTLSSISYFAEALHAETKKQGLPRNEQLLSLIRESTASAKASMSDIAWSLDPSNDSWEKLLSKMRRYAADLLEARSIRHSISIPATVPATTLSMEARQNIWLLFKEMIVNAVKHSGCTEIGISLRIENNLLILTVADNGLGFDANAVTDGRGVRNIRERAALLGGELRLETSRGNGTCWELVKPM